MLVDIMKELDKESLLSHIVVEGLSKALTHEELDKFLKGKRKRKKTLLNIKLTVEEVELDLESFVNLWQSQVHKLITKRAKELIEEKCSDTEELLDDLNTRLKEEVDKRLEDWEKEDEDKR